MSSEIETFLATSDRAANDLRGASPAGRFGGVPTPRSARDSDRNNRMRLLHAATDAFAEFGYEGASLRTIADDARVSFQLITYYFGTKEELWVATVDYLFERYLETGKGLGFTPTGNLHEQFHNHLRLLLTDMLQRPQMRNIWIQEYLAGSERYTRLIRPKIKHLHETLSLPYFQEVVRLGIVKRFTAQEIALIWSSVVSNNIGHSYYIELLLGVPTGTPMSVETQVDLVFEILVGDPEDRDDAALERASALVRGPSRAMVDGEPEAGAAGGVVYSWEDAKELTPDAGRIKQLELENLRLKQIVGNLSLEKQLLLDRLAALERGDAVG